MHILIIEDEEQLCRSMAEGLRMDGYETDTCFDGEEGLELCMTENYDLILLDLNLPGIDGLEILRQFRTFNTNTPVLILSARVQIQDKVEGLDLGANDYLTKPFHFEELEARIRSLTRRKFIQEDVCLRCSRITFDTRTREASVDGTPLALTRKESALLEYFLLHRNRIISVLAAAAARLAICRECWNVPGATSDSSRNRLVLMFDSSTSVTSLVKPKVFSSRKSRG